ncbi:hypothetical protein MLPF_0445 [Mycobacterium lepromatosis]|nr:hypothetical protein MLPF_0445 [Mycobacterium lepromatosis]
MIGRYRTMIELGLALLMFMGAEMSWLCSRYTVPIVPIADGQPITMFGDAHSSVAATDLVVGNVRRYPSGCWGDVAVAVSDCSPKVR